MNGILKNCKRYFHKYKYIYPYTKNKVATIRAERVLWAGAHMDSVYFPTMVDCLYMAIIIPKLWQNIDYRPIWQDSQKLRGKRLVKTS